MDNQANKKNQPNLCPSCFAETGQSETCPLCGYRQGDNGESDWNRLKSGTTIHGRYIVGKILGQGGFGITYLGLDSLLGLKLAIKEYYPTGVAVRNTTSRMVISASPDAREDFHRGMEKFLEEARILARFEGQPNIVSVRDFFQENGTAYMVMTYLEGRTLLKYLEERGGRIPFEEAMETLSPVMDALDEVHAAGQIHRDISPDNIFVTHNGQVKLLDFGASKSALNLMQQKSHSVILKRGYSPPEQYQSRGSLGPWTDVYGMAATLYRAVTGQVPPDSLDRLGEDALTLDGEMERMLPPLAREGLLLGLSLSPKARPQSMMEFKERLLGKASYTSGRTDEGQISSETNAQEISQSAAEKEDQKGNSMVSPMAMAIAFTVLIIFGFYVYFLEVQKSDPQSLFELGLKYQQGDGVPKDLTKAAELYQKAAEQGNAKAQNNLGNMYCFGRGVQQDYKKAVEWYSKGAEQGQVNAQNNLGYMYLQGLGVNKDNSKAMELYRKSAEQGNFDGQYGLGFMYEVGLGVRKDESKALDWYRKAAAQGHDESKKRLALLLAPSVARPAAARPTPPAPQEFIRIARLGSTEEIKKALESGASLEARDERYGGTPLMWAAAQNNDIGVLSTLLSAGANVNARDYNDGTALLWAAGANRGQEVLSLLLSAGADGDARDRSGDTMKSLLERHVLVSEAQKLLNDLGYSAGTVDGKAGPNTESAVKAFQKNSGLVQDGKISSELVAQLRRAKEQGVTARTAPSSTLNSPRVPASPATRPSAASEVQKNDPKSLYELAMKYEQGDGVPKDLTKAVGLYQKAAEQGYAPAQNDLGYMYTYGIGVPQDYSKAAVWYRKSAEQGNSSGQDELGSMYYQGRGVQQDYRKAVEWFRKSAEQGNASAQKTLGHIYRNGIGVPQDDIKAEEWYRKASEILHAR